MGHQKESSEVAETQPERQPQILKRNALGTVSIVFFVVAASSPLAAMTGVAPVIFGSMGIGGPSVYIIAAATLGLFAVGYTAMARHITSAAGFAAYVSRGLGPRAGVATAFVSLLAYNSMLAGILGQFSAFAHNIGAAQVGIEVPWPIWAAIGLLVVGVLGYHDVTISIRVIGTLMLVEVALLIIMDVAVIGQGGHNGLSAAAFTPQHVVTAGAGVGLLFAFSSFVGFEATTIYGEEARTPHRTIPRATYITVISIGVFYGITMWAIGGGYGSSSVKRAAQADPVNVIFSLGNRYVARWFSDVMQAFVFTALLAAMAAFQNVLARYIYSLARIGGVPRLLGRTHPRHQAPSAASLAQSATSIIIVGTFVLAGADPFAHLFSWLVGLGSLSIVTLEAIVAVSVIVFFRRTRIDRRLWQTAVAPLLGLCGLIGVIYLALDNLDVLVGATGWAKWLVLAIPAVVVIALGISKYRTVGDISVCASAQETDDQERVEDGRDNQSELIAE